MTADIDILLATYNGEKYLSQQIDSILEQTYTSWRLLISDDCSTDATPDIIRRYASQHSMKIFIVDNQGKNLGSRLNFGRLLQHSTADYVMFCDQDDVWLPEKISMSIERLAAMEKELGKDTPLMVHTDMKVVDEKLNPIADSFWDYQNLDPEAGRSLNRLILQNVPSGCAMMFNRALADKAVPIPADAFMHDWWLALVASSFGAVGYLRTPSFLYRQHGENVSGATKWTLLTVIRDFCTPRVRRIVADRRDDIFARLERQALAFLNRFSGELSPENREMLRLFSSISLLGFLKRRYVTIRYGIWYNSVVDNLGMLLFR